MIPIPAEFTGPLPASSDPADAGLIEVKRRQAALEAWSRSTKGKSDKECDRIADLETSFEDFMADTRAHTLAGVAVKLRLLRRHAADSCSWAPPCLKTALATVAEIGRLGGIEKLTAGGTTDLPTVPAKRREPPFDASVPASTPGSDEALSEAGRRLTAIEAFWNGQADAPDDAYADEVDALQHFIADAPAIGIEGIGVKFARVASLSGLRTVAAVGPSLIETITEALDRLAKA
jgi:hypothetical protein